MELSKLKPNRGAKKSARRVGRGESSGAGKTSGKGGKGQTARTGGGVRKGFEGGQMPLYRRVPKLGFRSRQKTLGINQYTIIQLEDLENFDVKTKITPEVLKKAGFNLHAKNLAGVKLLGNGTLTKAVHIEVHAVSAAAKAKVEAAGGSVTVISSAKAPAEKSA